MLLMTLDLATVTGWARGDIDGEPIAGSVRFGGKAGAVDNAVFADAVAWAMSQLDTTPVPDLLVIEAMLSTFAKMGHTTREVRDRLAGLHGIVRGCAQLCGVPRIETAQVGDVRQHFISQRNAKRSIAKRETGEMCRRLGWLACDDNAADALALWSYARALERPETALLVSPLFGRRRLLS